MKAVLSGQCTTVSATAVLRRQGTQMVRTSFERQRFPADIIRHAIWLYFRFTLSFRDVEEMLARRGIEVSYETVRCWTIRFGPQIAVRPKRSLANEQGHRPELVRQSAFVHEDVRVGRKAIRTYAAARV